MDVTAVNLKFNAITAYPLYTSTHTRICTYTYVHRYVCISAHADNLQKLKKKTFDISVFGSGWKWRMVWCFVGGATSSVIVTNSYQRFMRQNKSILINVAIEWTWRQSKLTILLYTHTSIYIHTHLCTCTWVYSSKTLNYWHNFHFLLVLNSIQFGLSWLNLCSDYILECTL